MIETIAVRVVPNNGMQQPNQLKELPLNGHWVVLDHVSEYLEPELPFACRIRGPIARWGWVTLKTRRVGDCVGHPEGCKLL